MRRSFVAGAAATLSVIGFACSASSDVGSEAGPAASTPVALAPSQLTASTVARPETPPPCDAGVLSWWTAQAAPAGTTSSAVVRVRNDGDVWCEVDISGSPSLADDAEPNVWLEPGEWADAIVASTSDRCSPAVADGVDVAVGDETVRVPSLLVASCAPTVVAFYVTELPEAACSELEAVAVDGNVLVRNAGFESCRLGQVVDGVEVESDGIEVVGLAAGDVVAIPVVPIGGECVTATSTVRFESGAEVPIADAGGCVVAGPARPWFPAVDSASDVDDVLAMLDVFG